MPNRNTQTLTSNEVITEYSTYLQGVIPVFDPFLEGTLEGAEGHGLRHGNVLVQECHVVVHPLQNTRACS